MYNVDNAVIMAAGVSSRFAPLSFEKPKALTEVKGEVMIERQIEQLRAAGVKDIYIVVGYKAEQFAYLQNKYSVHLLKNEHYLSRNNHSSIYTARKVIRNTYICSADNYFLENPFERQVEESYYAAVYAPGDTWEWCVQTDEKGYINRVTVGGHKSWYMLGHAFWDEKFSERFLALLTEEFELPTTKNYFWEDIYVKNLDTLKMRMRKYPDNYIFEFDSIDELRLFDESYIADTRSSILKEVAQKLNGTEAEIKKIETIKSSNTDVQGFQFEFHSAIYTYTYADRIIRRIPE